MKKTGWILSALLSTASAQALAEPQRYLVDTGDIILKPVTDKHDKVTYKIPDSCPGTTLEIAQSGSNIKITHSGKKCPSGAQVTIPVAIGADTVVQLSAGVVRVENARSFASKFSEIKLKVEAGLIQSAFVSPSRSSNYAGSQAVVSNKEGSGKLEILIRSGLIHF